MSTLARRWGINLYEKVTGRRILPTLDMLLRTQWSSRDELEALHKRKLQALIEYANQNVPYYRRLFKEIGFEPGDLKRDPDCFDQIPTVDKNCIRDNTEDFVTTDPLTRAKIQTHSTSGSTGHPFIFWEDHNYRDHVTADILRHLSWAGWEFGKPHAYLWGLPVNPPFKHKIRTGLMDFALNRFVRDAYILSEESLHQFGRQIQQRRPIVLFGYPSSILHFARFVQEEGLENISFQGVFCSAEVLYPHQRQVIEEVFGCKVFNRYAALETGGLACECEAHTALHISLENCKIEVLNGEKPALPGEAGQIVITNLNNYGLPFIRYRLGDIVGLSKLEHCPCQRQHPLLEVIEGRQVDMFRTLDGRTIWGDFQSNIFEVEGIRQFQIVQKAVDLIVIKLVTEQNFQKTHLDIVERIVQEVMGPGTKITFEFLDSIPASSSGKFRYAISEVANPN